MAIGKWTVLVLACFITFGAYYSFDFPSVLHNQLFQHFKTEDEQSRQFELDFSLIYSVYSLPNTFIPLIGGILVDQFGNKRVMVVFGGFVLLGNTMQSYACVSKSMSLYILGRFVFGFGSETLGVCANTIISKWFMGQELAFSMAINLSACKLAGVLNDWISPVVEQRYGVDVTSFSVTAVCFVCFALTLLLVYLEPPEQVILSTAPNNDLPSGGHIELGSTDYFQISDNTFDAPDELPGSVQEVQEYRSVTRGGDNAVIDDELVRHSLVRSAPGQPALERNSLEYHRRSTEVTEEGASLKTSSGCCSDLLASMCKLNVAVWLIFVLTFLMYGVFVPFTNISNPILLEFFFQPSTDPAVIARNQVNAAW